MKRLLASSSGAVVVVFGLFVLMMGLIHQKAPAYTGERVIFPDKVFFDERTIVEERPQPKEKPKLAEVVEIELVSQSTNKPNSTIDKIDSSIPGGINLAGGESNNIPGIINGIGSNGDNEANPIVMIQPLYPEKAASNNIEGWVKLRYDITTSGTVKNVKVIQSKPRGIFESSAKKALYRWKYTPSSVDGKSVASIGHVVMLEFNFEKE